MVGHAQFGTMLEAIGNTPIVQLRRLPSADAGQVLVKLETGNPTGSYKDRMALSMIEEAMKRGDLEPGMTVLEYTGGSTGSSLAFVCAVKGLRFRVVSSDAFAQEKLKTMQAFGAELELVPSEGGQATPDLVPRMVERAAALAEGEDVYFTDQLNNRDSLLGYRSIGKELVEEADGQIGAFCGAIGTAGMLMGVAQVLKERQPEVRIVALEPAESPVLTEGEAGPHNVDGIAIGYVPPHLDEGLYDEARAIPEVRAREVVRRLAREEGMLVGTSSGLNVAAAMELAEEMGPGATVATVAVDTGLKYLSGDLFER